MKTPQMTIKELTRERINQLTADERKHVAKEETGLHGTWKEAGDVGSALQCPTCDSAEHLYIYADNKTCYCLDCAIECDIADCVSETCEWDIAELLGETQDGLSDGELAEMISDDPTLASRLADSIIAKNDAPKTDKATDAKLEAARKMADNITKNYKHKYSGPGQSYNSYLDDGIGFKSFFKNCYHRPQHIIAGEGFGVWAGKKDDCKSSANEFDIVLNLTFNSIKDNHVIPIPELKQFEDRHCPFKELQLDWPDYGVIDMPKEFWTELAKYVQEHKQKLLVFCTGGHGRTGTSIAILLCLMLDYSPKQAIDWVRKNYCNQAIETAGQEAYIYAMAGKRVPRTVQDNPYRKAAGNSLAAKGEN